MEPIAIVGIGCRFPGGVDSPESFWELLCHGVDAIGNIPAQRWESHKFYHPEPDKPDKTYMRQGGFLQQPLETFDAAFFGISPREAAQLDPQQRLLLETAWEAIEDGGFSPIRWAGAKVGVFIGAFSIDNQLFRVHPTNRSLIDSHTATGSGFTMLSAKLSYFFDLRGPCITLDTACSSSLVAVHYACQSLWHNECIAALAGGVNVMFRPEFSIIMSKGRFLSPDARCRTFDASANGYVRGEGAGVIVLKKLSSALADGDPIRAVILATGINQDGHTPGITVPNQIAQQELLQQVCAEANVPPAAVNYVEAHGTGTPVGDPIEATALGTVYGQQRPANQPCIIGSVKTNIGHLEAAAGIAGLIKAVLCLEHKQIPPHLHLKNPNPKIPLEKLGLRLPQSLEAWPETLEPARVAVNSFGYGGTNAHAILQQAPLVVPTQAANFKPDPPGHPQILLISARGETALKAQATAFAGLPVLSDENSRETLRNLCRCAAIVDSRHQNRLAVQGNTAQEMRERLLAFASGVETSGIWAGRISSDRSGKVAFVYTGMGPQWWAMGRELLQQEPVFRDSVHEIDSAFRRIAGFSVLESLLADEASSRMNEAAIAQTTNFTVQIALTQLWRAWGVVPDAIVGHSVGEVAAAFAAGVLSLDDAVTVSYHRSRIQSQMTGQGKMLAVGLSVKELGRFLEGWEQQINIAAINAPNSMTLSGDSLALESVAAQLKALKIFHKFLRVDIPYHSFYMESGREELLTSLQNISSHPPQIPIYSTVTGRLMDGMGMGAQYWWRNVREPVQFALGMNALIYDGYEVFWEIGPHPVLASAIAENLKGQQTEGVLLHSLQRNRPERVEMLQNFGRWYTIAHNVDGRRLYRESGPRLKLPRYPWQREVHWLESIASQAERLGVKSRLLLGQPVASPEPAYEVDLSDARLSYLSDHKIEGNSLFPAAGYIEAALSVGEQTVQGSSCVLEGIEFCNAFVLNANEASILRISLDQQGVLSFQSSNKLDPSTWTLNALATLRQHPAEITVAGVDIEARRDRCPQNMKSEELYLWLDSIGLQYGANFRGVQQLWRGQDEVLCEIYNPTGCPINPSEYRLHPSMLDAAFQSMLAATGVNSRESPRVFLPVEIEQLTFIAGSSERVWASGQIVRRTKTLIIGNIDLFDETGKVLVQIKGFKCKAIGSRAASKTARNEDWLYTFEWRQIAQNLQQKRSLASVAEPLSNNFPSVANLVAKISPVIADLAAAHQLKAADELWHQLDRIGLSFAIDALQKLGWDFYPAELVTLDAVIARLGVAPQCKRFLAFLLELLSTEGILRPVPGGWEVVRPVESSQAPLLDPDWEQQFPACLPELNLVRRCWSQFPQLLQGQVDPLQILFPGGDLSITSALFETSPTFAFHNQLVAKAVAALWSDGPKNHPLRILEIGAGTGGTTAWVLPHLPLQGVEYFFTDVSAHFTQKAAERFAQYPFMRFATLDMEKDPGVQGFLPQSFDVVLAANAIHAGADLRQILEFIHQLLAPQGLLILAELTYPRRVINFTFGWLDGWWKFKDFNLRSSSPLLSRRTWCDLLTEMGWSDASAVSADSGEGEPNQAVIIARRSPVRIDEEGLNNLSSLSPVIFLDERHLGQSLVEAFKSYGVRPIVVTHAEEFVRETDDWFRMRSDCTTDLVRLFSELEPTSCPRHLFYLRGLNIDTPNGEEPLSIRSSGLEDSLGVLHLVQVLMNNRETMPSRLWLVTCGSQSIGQLDRVTSPAQAALWGLGRVVSSERPELHCSLVDLDPIDLENGLRQLCEIALSNDPEPELAFRGGGRFSPRLVRVSSEQAEARFAGELPEETSFHLETSERLSLNELVFREIPRRPPGFGEVEIRVEATGVNFKDVLKSMGILSDLVIEGTHSQHSLGLECSGTIVRVGEGVKDLQVGEAVICWTSDCFGRFVTAPDYTCLPVLDSLTLEQQAALPVVFVTALYCLEEVGRLQPDERVLIHAATGGVGLAALQVAQRIGAEVLATAGSPEKREFLRALGIRHVFDSRSLSFADEVMEATEGRGVDVVLNSLVGEGLRKSIAVLSPYGRLIDIAKRDIDENSSVPLRPFNRNLTFSSVDIDRLLLEKPLYMRKMIVEIRDRFVRGEFTPLPITVFTGDRVTDAFRLLAQAKHIGKVILLPNHPQVAISPGSETPLKLRSDATYAITGGVGGVGLRLARWLVERGARHLALLTRNTEEQPETLPTLSEIETLGVQVRIFRADVTCVEQLHEAIKTIHAEMPLIRGIFHLAMLLDDGLLQQLDANRFKRVYEPKALGAWHLHEQTLNLPLDHFVMFSSMASVVGNPGQANYSAGNAFLDALVHFRRQRGLPALAIAWGPLADAGFVARNQKIAHHLQQQGLKPLPLDEALEMMGRLLGSRFSHLGVMDVDWSVWSSGNPALFQAPRYDELRSELDIPTTRPEDDTMRSRLLLLSPSERLVAIEAILREIVAKVLGTLPDRLPLDQNISHFGVDSLMAVELQNLTLRRLGVELPSMDFVAGSSISQLADRVLAKLIPTDDLSGPDVTALLKPSSPVPVGIPSDPLQVDINTLSDEEVDAMLQALLLESEKGH